MSLNTAWIARKIVLTDYESFLVKSDEWMLSSGIWQVQEVSFFTNRKKINPDPIGRINIVFPETITINHYLRSDFNKVRKCWGGQPVDWCNNGKPVRLFYENYLSNAVFEPYDVTIVLKVLQSFC